MKKKILSLALALVMCLGLLPTVSLAASSGTCGNGVTWTLDDSGRLTIDGQGAMDDYVHPWDDKSVTSIVIKGGITYVGSQCFQYCGNVESVTVEEGVTSLGRGAFYMIGSYKHDCRVTLPSTITELPDSAFAVSYITSVNIPSGVTSIGGQAFDYCNRLTSITIPASVKRIGSYAFKDCTALTSIALQGVPDFVDSDSFLNVPSSASFTFNGTQEQWDALSDSWENATTEQIFFGHYATDIPTVKILVESPKETITIELANKGTVELSEDNPNLEFDIHAPAGTKISTCDLLLYTTGGKFIDIMEDHRVGTITKSPNHVSYPMWRTPQNGALVYPDCSLTLGETYRYELQSILDGKTYTSDRGTFRVAKPQTETFTVSLLNPMNMTYYPDIQVTNGQPYGKLPTPTLSGWTFTGWYNADKKQITESTIANLTKDETLYAYWTKEAAITLTNDNTPTNGVVEINPSDSQLKATLTAPEGKKISQWDMTIYTTSGSVVKKIAGTPGGGTTLVISMWTIGGTPKEGQVLDYGDFKLTVGTVYEYEFTAVVEDVTYRTGRTKFRLSTTAQPQQPTGTKTANPTNDKLKVNGVVKTPTVYKIGGSNYFKIRDVAAVLNGTKKQFNVGYANGKVTVTSNHSYDTATGKELAGAPANSKSATRSNDTIIIDGVETSLTVYKIGGSNYFKLRDLGKALDFYVGYSGGQVSIDTSKPYSE